MSSRRNAPALLDRGTIVAGRYRIDDCLAWGGMGVVYAATHISLDHKIALKFLRPDLATDAEACERFLDEARMAAAFRGEHVAHVLDYGHHDQLPYMVVEYLEGVDLWTVLDESDVVPIQEAVDYVAQACAGLAEVHAAGIVHRDLKPENLFLAVYPNGGSRIKVLDFGVSKRLDSGRSLTKPKKGVGSPLYMSPEQMRAHPIDGRADVWALGTVLYELLTGQLPFDAESVADICNRVLRQPPPPPRRRRGDLPPQLEAVILRCLEKDPNRRFADVAELAAALAPFGLPSTALAAEEAARVLGRKLSVPQPTERAGRRALKLPRRAVTAAAAAVALLAAIGLEASRAGGASESDLTRMLPPQRAAESMIDGFVVRIEEGRAAPEREAPKQMRASFGRSPTKHLQKPVSPSTPEVEYADRQQVAAPDQNPIPASPALQCPQPAPSPDSAPQPGRPGPEHETQLAPIEPARRPAQPAWQI
jgi:eukaryotic-like serine/threonine-protein kinase